MSAGQELVLVKLLHTAIWAVMASAVLAIPICALRGNFRAAKWLSLLILAECIVLALNAGRCPLTDIAARFTAERQPNFDIYLPLWLAQYNKHIFGSLFVLGELIWLWRWLAKRSQNENGVTRR